MTAGRVIVCGDRGWKDREYLFARMDEMRSLYGIEQVVEGCARGADRLAEEWAVSRGLAVWHHPADWNKYGKPAGVIRNGEMLAREPFMVVAFHTALQQSKGTRHMVEIARAKGVPSLVFPHSHEGYGRRPSPTPTEASHVQ